MKRAGLLLKTNIYLLSAVVLIFVLTIGVIGFSTSANDRDKANRIAELKAGKVASEVKNYLQQAMETTNTIAQTMQTLREEGHASRELVLANMKRFLRNNPDYYGIWTMWEPNAFDGKDADYARRHHQEHGRFACSYYRAGGELLRQNFGSEELPAYVSSDWLHEYDDAYYRLAKERRRQVLMEPYYYSYTGEKEDERLMTSVIVPILFNGEVIGVVGTDIDLASLQSLIQQSKVYQTGFVAIISNEGKVVAHPESGYLAKSLQEVFETPTDSISKNIRNGQFFSDQNEADGASYAILRFFSPIEIGDTETPWSVMVEVPLKEVMAESHVVVIKVIWIGVLSLMLVSLVVFGIVRTISRPVLRGIHLAKNISLGKLEEPLQMPDSNDEIGELGEAFQNLIEKLKLMQQVSEIGYWELDLETLKMDWSDGLFRLLGFSAQEFEPDFRKLLRMVHPKDADKIETAILVNSCKRKGHDARFRIKLPTGQTRYLLIKCQGTKEADGKIVYSIGVILDVTTLVRKEKKLKESEKKFKDIFNTSNDAILVVNKKGNFIDANQKAFDRSGLSRKELFQLNYRDIVVGEHDANQYAQLLFEGKEGRFETEYVNAMGQKIYLEINGKAMKHKGKNVFLLISRDISERKEMEKKMIQAIIQTEEKERSRMAKELHDGVSPVLSTVKLYSNAIIDSNDEAFKKRITSKLIVAIEEAIKGIYEISNNLTPHVLQNFGIITALQTFIEKLQETTTVNYQLDTNVSSRLPEKIEVTVYRVITELLNNTIKHAGATEVSIEIHQNDNLHVVYRDNGCGFDLTEARNKKGSMGLFNMTNRVKSLNGTFQLESAPGQGMSVIINLPIEA